MQIKFIPWKNLSTKSIADKVVSAHFEVPANFDFGQWINKPLTMKVVAEWTDTVFEFPCYIPNEWNVYVYSATQQSYSLKLDIQLPTLLVLGYVVGAKIITITP